MDSYLLAGDIGGTKTVLALFKTDDNKLPITPIMAKRYPSDKYDSLQDIVTEFVATAHQKITAASFGVAGPVVDGQARITNLPWHIDSAILKEALRTDKVVLLNDLEAIANAVPYLAEKDITILNEGQPNDHGTIGVVAPGTGLGEAFLVWNGNRYESYPSEGGHASFSPTTPQQQELLTFLWQKYHHVSFERVCSGKGIPNLYAYMRHTGRYDEPAWLQKAVASAQDPTPTIVNSAIDNNVPICVATLALFIEILAGEAANMALKVLATGGIYLGGGIPPRILPQIQKSDFVEVFRQKGRFTELLTNVPVYVVENPQSALYGAAYQGLYLVQES